MNDGQWRVQCDRCEGFIDLTREQVVAAIGEAETQYLEKIADRTRTVDVTPTWRGLCPAFFGVLENPDAPEESKAEIRAQIMRMAEALDLHNAAMKQHRAIDEWNDKHRCTCNDTCPLHAEADRA